MNWSSQVLDSSHIIFLISKCNLPALRNAQRVLHGFERLGYSASRIRLVVNRYQKGQDLSLKEVEKSWDFKFSGRFRMTTKRSFAQFSRVIPLTLQTNSIPLAKSFYDMSAQGSWHSDRISSQIRWRLLGSSERHSQQVDAANHSQSIEELVRFGNSTERLLHVIVRSFGDLARGTLRDDSVHLPFMELGESVALTSAAC
jgi:hypothetical protein